MKKYWHALTPGLVGALVKFKKTVIAKGENNLRPRIDACFTAVEWSNLTKLRFHAMIAKAGVRGTWLLTRRGSLFLRGELAVPRRVLTWRNKVVGYDDVKVNVGDVFTGDLPVWEEHHAFEYAAPEGALAGTPEVQLELFS